MPEHPHDDFILKLPAGATAAAAARQFVDAHTAELPTHLAEDAVLLVSELVTNAVLHGRPDITLRLSTNPPLLGVAVDDEGEVLPPSVPPHAELDATHGRGLLIVERLASDWGVDASGPGPGKTVWFHIAPGPD